MSNASTRALCRHKPNKKQQLKHAMTVQSAHMITTDYVSLSQLSQLIDGVLLNDRTEHKLKLIHSLGELQPMHTYTTEYGNVLERPTKHKAILAGSIELEITTDEADFDAEMERLALANGDSKSLPSAASRTASPTSGTSESDEGGSADELERRHSSKKRRGHSKRREKEDGKHSHRHHEHKSRKRHKSSRHGDKHGHARGGEHRHRSKTKSHKSQQPDS